MQHTRYDVRCTGDARSVGRGESTGSRKEKQIAATQEQATVIAVVAAFRPDDSFADNVTSAMEQVARVVVVDDGSGPQWSETLRLVEEIDPDRIEVIVFERNRGIAAALNSGVRRALDLGAEYVLTLDQDSRLAAGYVSAALDAAARVQQVRGRFGAIAAGVQSGRTVRPVAHADRGQRLTPTAEAIQSGLLIPRPAIRRLGLFDEALFIDCVDTDYVLRAATASLPTYLARACRLDHPLGRTMSGPGIPVTRSGQRSFAFHPAWRRYYISRNRVIMLGRHGYRQPRWAITSLLGESVQFGRSLAFGPDKGLQALAFLLGVLDALRGQRGRLRGSVAVALGGHP